MWNSLIKKLQTKFSPTFIPKTLEVQVYEAVKSFGKNYGSQFVRKINFCILAAHRNTLYTTLTKNLLKTIHLLKSTVPQSNKQGQKVGRPAGRPFWLVWRNRKFETLKLEDLSLKKVSIFHLLPNLPSIHAFLAASEAGSAKNFKKHFNILTIYIK